MTIMIANKKAADGLRFATPLRRCAPRPLDRINNRSMMNLVVIGLIVVLASILLTRAYSGYLGAITMIVGLYLMSKGRNKMNQK